MDRHVLIAVSEQKSSLYGVRFVGNFFSDKKTLKSTLFYCTPKAPALWEEEKSLEANQKQKNQQNKLLAKGKTILEETKKECIKLGFLQENISLKLQTQTFTKVADIIQEGEKGKYDAVVLGRRGLSMLEKTFEDSVSKALFSQTFTFPIWLCKSSDPKRKNVLLYIDGSKTSFRMADHVGFVLSQEKQQRVDILVSEEAGDTKELTKKCRGILMDHGLPETLIRQKTVKADNAAKLIIGEARKEQYAAVALGRSGQEKGLLMRLFKGPICSVLFKELQETALWVCR